MRYLLLPLLLWNFTVHANMVEIPLKKCGNMLFVELELNSKKAWFLIDTGASISLIDYHKRRFFQIKCSRQHRFLTQGMNSSQARTYRTSGYCLQYQDNILTIPLMSISMIQLCEHIYKKYKLYISGIIGSDFLSKHQARIDYERNIITIKVKKALE